MNEPWLYREDDGTPPTLEELRRFEQWAKDNGFTMTVDPKTGMPVFHHDATLVVERPRNMFVGRKA